MLKQFLTAFGVVVLTTTHAVAQSPRVLNYEFFEFAIPHLDLDECPKDVARAGAFCRITTANDSVHVFVFDEKDKQCLLAVKSYSDYQISVK